MKKEEKVNVENLPITQFRCKVHETFGHNYNKYIDNDTMYKTNQSLHGFEPANLNIISGYTIFHYKITNFI